MPAFASDGVSSVAYAPDEILLALSLAGLTAMMLSPWVGISVGIVMLVVVVCYRQNVRAYPSGGGDYEIANRNIGPGAGITAAAALLVDYVLTVAVSITAATHYIAIGVPALRGHEVILGVAMVVIVTIASLRGRTTAGKLMAVPVYLFLGAVLVTIAVGLVRVAAGDIPRASTADFTVLAADQTEGGLMTLAAAFLVLRAFSSGCVALAGVETIATNVPSFRKPRGKNAGTTLVFLGLFATVMLIGITYLASVSGVRYVSDPGTQLLDGRGQGLPSNFLQDPVLGQVAEAVFSSFTPAFYVVTLITAVVLMAAANTSFTGFPHLASRLAQDGYLPRQLASRGDRLTHSNGILLLAVAAIVLIVATGASTPRLIELYLVGVFLSFTLGQFGMVRHWTTRLRLITDPATLRRMRVSRAINIIGAIITAGVLIVVVVTKFFSGAWVAIVAVAVLFLVMGSVHKHYLRVAGELAPDEEGGQTRLPANIHGIVLVSQVHKPTLRALAYARAARPTFLEAVTVNADEAATEALQATWDAQGIPVALTVLDSPYREITRPILAHIASIRRRAPQDVIIVYIPEYLVGHWWEHVLHNQTALRLKTRLLYVPGVMVASVPWRLSSFERIDPAKP